MKQFDAHRLIGLIARYPRHKFRFKVWQFMWIKMHVKNCFICQERIESVVKKHPSIGPVQELN